MTFESFLQFEMTHAISGINEDIPPSSGLGASLYPITGYTEWISDSIPVITIGWDWEMTGYEGAAQLRHIGIPGTNLMFVCKEGNDLGTDKTLQLLKSWLGIFSWQTVTLNTIHHWQSPVNFDSC